MDPIDNPDYNPHTYRPPNEATIERIRELGKQYHDALDVSRELRYQLDLEIIAAKEAGHSYHQLREASGLSIATIQKIIERKDYK